MAPARALALLEPVLRRSPRRTGRASSTATSSRRTSSSPTTAGSRSPTSGWPARSTPTPAHRDRRRARSARSPTCRPSWSSTARPTPRSDVYAAGVLLYEMLTGRKPHQGESPIQVAYKHVHEDIPPPSCASPGTPAVRRRAGRARHRPRARPAAGRRAASSSTRYAGSVSALDHGVTDDPELTADLLPPGRGAPRIDDTDELFIPRDPAVEPERRRRRHRAPSSSRGSPARGARRSRAAHRRRPSPPTLPSPTPSPAGRPPRPAPRRSRRGRVLLLVLLLALLVGLGGWYLGVARYTPHPASSTCRCRGEGQGREGGSRASRSSTRTYSETVTAGSVISTDPNAGSRSARAAR